MALRQVRKRAREETDGEADAYGARRRAPREQADERAGWQGAAELFGHETLAVDAPPADGDNDAPSGDRWTIEDARAAGYNVKPQDPRVVAQAIDILREGKARRADERVKAHSAALDAKQRFDPAAYAPPADGEFGTLSPEDRAVLVHTPEYKDFELELRAGLRAYDELAEAARLSGWSEAAVGLSMPAGAIMAPGTSANLYVSRSLERPWGMYIVTGATGGFLYRTYTRRQ